MSKIEWVIKQAKFVFEDSDEYEMWKKEQKVFFEFAPTQADDSGENLFSDAESLEFDKEIDAESGSFSVSLEDDGPIITASCALEIPDKISEDALEEWSSEHAGWESSSINLGDYDAYISGDDGGEWRFSE